MIVKFSMDEIKDMNLLYSWSEKETSYNGKEYCDSVLRSVCNNLQFMEHKNIHYLGSLERIANETFNMELGNPYVYQIAFMIDTYEDKRARMEVSISTEGDGEPGYDDKLEKLKIALKNRLLEDWGSCTWLIDEQSTALCKEAYEKASILENEIRAFVSKVLIHHLGVNWIKRAGLEKIDESVKSLAEKFTNNVPEFCDINTDFLSMTLETLSAVMFDGEIYDDVVKLTNTEYLELQRMCGKNGVSAINIADYVRKRRKPVAKLWEKYFVPFLDNPDAFKKAMHDFIEDRNHVAHSKVLSWSAYGIMLKDFAKMEVMLRAANAKYETEEASIEIMDTRDVIEEDIAYQRQYHRDRVEMETGMDILSEEAIIDWFDKVVYELYSDIYQRYHLDVGFEVSDYYPIGSNHISFCVSCPVEEDRTLIVEVSAEHSVDDDLSSDSICVLTAQNGNGDCVDSAEIHFHNGNGCEGEDGLMEATDNTAYDTSEVDGFKEILFDAIDHLNPYPTKLEALEYESKGAARFVSDYPCEQCGKMGISISEEFLPVGTCCYCGYAHKMEHCYRCDELVSVGELEQGYCPSCRAYIDEQ